MSTRDLRARIAAVAVAALAALGGLPGVAVQRPNAFGRSSIDGSGSAVMQVEMVPARISRVAAVPGTREAWAVGTSTARLEGWDYENPAGQVVFLRHTPATGWVMTGPPRDRSGRFFNPVLGGVSIAPGGEGWAVGEGGLILRKAPGATEWAETADSRRATQRLLTSVSVVRSKGAVVGYASGAGPTVLRLSQGRWSEDATGAVMAETTELVAIAAVSADDAWAVATGEVSGSDTTRLLVYERTASGWNKRSTGMAYLDGPPAPTGGNVVVHAAYAGAVAADATGAWIGGQIYPRSTRSPEGDRSPGDATRPVMVRYDKNSGEFESYCPDQYDVRSGEGEVDLTPVCDHPFPQSTFYVTSIQILPGGEAFAGGLGLYRFSGSGWYREPNAVGYIISLAMLSKDEGFMATPGTSFGTGGTLRSNAAVIGHFTKRPARPAVARWSHPAGSFRVYEGWNAGTLESIAYRDDGSGAAVAVGYRGDAIINYGGGWDSINRAQRISLHGVAWPRGGVPWAVGEAGIVYRLNGSRWTVVANNESGPSLFGVDFRTPTEGVAVGLAGSIVRLDGTTVRRDPASGRFKDLYAIHATGDGYVIVGSDGTWIEGVPGAWRLRPEARRLLIRENAPVAPTLYTIAELADGRVVAGGQDGSILVREGGVLRLLDAPLEGTVLALAASGNQLVASVSPDASKYNGERLGALRGTIMKLEGTRWRDVAFARRVTPLRGASDSASFEDPVFSIAMSPGLRGWGAGGTPPDVPDAEGRLRKRGTASIYRVDLDGDPRQPSQQARLDVTRQGVAFAAFGESWCGKGFCSSTLGIGTHADEVSLAIRREINEASKQPGGPKFVLYTGNMRGRGTPEEMEQFRGFLRGFRIPVYAALGNLDRFGGLDVARRETGGLSETVSGTAPDFWMHSFRGAPFPWGTGKTLPEIREVRLTAEQAATPGRARTHYAFDYLRDGHPALRVVVFDSSTRSYSTEADQNPRQSQETWFGPELLEVSHPVVVVMNQPTVLPKPAPNGNWTAGQETFEGSVAAAGVSAVITGGPRMNAQERLKLIVPQFIVGGGGAPLGYESTDASLGIETASKLPTDGYYNAWHLFTVRDDLPALNALGQRSVDLSTMPVLESVGVHSFEGTVIPAGNTTHINVVARGLNGGFSDPDQSIATYMSYGHSLIPQCGASGQGLGSCVSISGIHPHVRLYSENPDIADFAIPHVLNPSAPIRGDGGEVIRDPGGRLGFLCTFKLGTARIRAVVGLRQSFIDLTVGPGFGPCNERPVEPPPPRPTPTPPLPTPEPEPPRVFPRVEVPVEVAVVPPPPVPIVAPAPPVAGGYARKEKHEAVKEQQGSEFRALRVRSRYEPEGDPAGVVGSLVALALASAFGTALAARVRAARQESPSRRTHS